MTNRRHVMFVRRPIAPALAVLLALALARPTPGQAGPAPVSDPVSVGWDGGWVVYRYSESDGRWSSWKSPDAPLPYKVFPAVGPHAVAIIDPKAGYGGWHFDLHARNWSPIPISPISGPTSFMDRIPTAFVGPHLVVWGMTRDVPHGAVLDTRTMKWKPIAEAPIPIRYRAATAVVGSRLIVWGGFGPNDPGNPRRIGPLKNGAVYDVDKDLWEEMPAPPEPAPALNYAWTTWNDRLVLFGGTANRVHLRTGLVYDPVARSWEAIPEAPFDLGRNSACAASKDRLFVWSGEWHTPPVAGDGRTRYSSNGGTYDFARRQWQKLPDAPIEPRLLAYALARGTEVSVWGGWDSSTTPPPFFRSGATYDLEQGTWRPLPPLPADLPYAVHSGW
jgi:hypothetical protein